MEEVMHQNSTRLAFSTIGIVMCWFSTATAQSQDPASPRCPEGYWLMESLCLNGSTGDVVNAASAAASAMAVEPGCAPGYWRLDRLCHSSETGDVELADEKRWPAAERAAARK
jgi:hypothetical protein